MQLCSVLLVWTVVTSFLVSEAALFIHSDSTHCWCACTIKIMPPHHPLLLTNFHTISLDRSRRPVSTIGWYSDVGAFRVPWDAGGVDLSDGWDGGDWESILAGRVKLCGLRERECTKQAHGGKRANWTTKGVKMLSLQTPHTKSTNSIIALVRAATHACMHTLSRSNIHTHTYTYSHIPTAIHSSTRALDWCTSF